MSKRLPNPTDHQPYLACFPFSVGHDRDGVCLLLTIGSYRILLDCGLTDVKPLLQETPTFDAVICSHAHADHAQGLLQLHQALPQLPIYASEVTVDLLSLNWLDTPEVAETPFCQGLPWRSPLSLFDDLQVELYSAGHLPGASAILLTYHTRKRIYKILYTGDFSLSNLQLVEGLSIETLRGLTPDILIIEGSYGTIRHPHRRQQEKHLMQRIYRALEEQYNVLLPVPPLGLGQEILKLLRSHHQFTGRDVDIWVSGTTAIACDKYLELLPQFPLSVQNFAKHQPLFWDERICPRLRRLPAKKNLELEKKPCIFLGDDLTRISSYISRHTDPWLILLPQQSDPHLVPEASPFRSLKKRRNVTLETYLLTQHSDGRNTTQLIHNLRPQHVIFVHGNPNYLADLTSLEELQNRYQLHSPLAGIKVELPIGDRFIQPAAPSPTTYEGELNELDSAIHITLPSQLSQDSRWSQFADTGLVEAHWQGEELVLRGIRVRELLSQNNERRGMDDVDCCQTCSHFRAGRCWNTASPLNGFKVTPEGYCPVFEPREIDEQEDI